MVQVYSTSNTNAPIGRIADYNNTSPSRQVALYRILNTDVNPISISTLATGPQDNDFAQAIYAGGPYSLLHPNSTTDFCARNIDVLA